MRIAWNCIYFGEKAGCAKQMTNLFRQLERMDTANEHYVFLNGNMVDFFKFENKSFHKIHVGKWGDAPAPAILYRQTILPIKIKRLGVDLYVDTNNPLIFLKTAKTIAIIRDMGECYIPDKYDKRRMFYRRKIMLPITMRCADKIITSSNLTRNDILKFYKVNTAKITVIHEGKDEDFNGSCSKESLEGFHRRYPLTGEKYILHVGRLDPIGKNILRLIEAFSILKKQYAVDHKLLLVGTRWRGSEAIDKQVERLNLKNDVVFAGYTRKEDLPIFYATAQALVFPSLYEGFGHPVIEAMSCRCPVVCSNGSSLPEVAGDAAVYFDPYDVKDMAEKVFSVLTNETLKKQMIEKGLENIKRFDWEKHAAHYLKLFEEVVHEKKAN